MNQRTSVGEVTLASSGARSRGKRESFVLEPTEAATGQDPSIPPIGSPTFTAIEMVTTV